MTLDAALRPEDAQRIASDPKLSAFVMANAGSGKTKTLIDRVARLLLADVKPEAILCVTYTKAAAAEMQRRLFDLLGGWSVAPDEDLARDLRKLEDQPYDAAALTKARRLFAAALETPGGLKIQTIHAFCEKLLQRFPLEAGVPPGFRVMDDAGSAAVSAAARAAVARHALGGEGAVAEAYRHMSIILDFQRFQDMFAGFETRRGVLNAFLEREGGLDGACAAVWSTSGFNGPTAEADIAARAMDALDRDLWRKAAAVLAGGSPKNDVGRAQRLAAIAAGPEATISDALSEFFTERGEGDAAKWIEQPAVLKKRPDLQALLFEEQARLETVRDRMRASVIAADTTHVLTLANAYLAAYRIEKAHAGALDFADLIDRTRTLLASRPAAAWVLYKLDGGIDHILVDEAQDTAQAQWDIVRALTQEFFSGAGVRGLAAGSRQMFVVGDVKQSIYSFQGARPEQLAFEFAYHRERALGAGTAFERVALQTSWRSAPPILQFVDAVFAAPERTWAIQSSHETVRHEVMRTLDPGCVDVWDLIQDVKDEERRAWDAPLDQEGDGSANRRLARRIAAEVQALIARGDAVYDKDLDVDGRRVGGWRAANAGDVLILVRRRSALFEDILRELKRIGVPVAGADRLALSEHIVFDDLLALARFTRFPDDDLTLAALLKSPFCDLGDEDLFQLAYARGSASLWSRLTARAGEHPVWGEALAVLERARTLADTCRPFEFYSGVLSHVGADGRSLRWKVLKRLGADAEEALDEYLAQVLAAETRGVFDLERLAHAFTSLDITIKREMEAAGGQVRVMTAHGAKGLEAPIVFLPETTLTKTGRPSPLLEMDDERGIRWVSSQKRDSSDTAEARARRQQREEDEAQRLLYVAMTRARDRLVLCGRISTQDKEESVKGWWRAMMEALDHPAIAPHVRTISAEGETSRRFGEDPRPMPIEQTMSAISLDVPDWARRPAAPEAFARYASPSDLGEGGWIATPSPLAQAGGLGRFRRGELIHRLLQLLPDLPTEARAAGAASLLAREADLADRQRAEMCAAALGVLNDPQFAEVFGPGSRAEAAVAGGAPTLPPGLKISGRIDRLVVLLDRVLVVDFKTNRPAPARIDDADPAYLRQMALYAAVLAEVFPGRRIEAALVWTDGPKLMGVPEFLLAQTLADLRRSG